jgi:hypothetical protein
MAGFSISDINDGNFANIDSCGDCLGCFSTNPEAGAAWISVQMLHPTIVRTVILVNREDSGINNMAGSEIRVGFNVLPSSNQLCALASTSGVYVCSTAILGEYIALYNPNMQGLAL